MNKYTNSNSDYTIVMDKNVSFDGDWEKVKQIVKKVHNIKNQVITLNKLIFALTYT